jgi:VIT1/CCC1 family predicted Fe2+/Mn2+ transporter
MRWQLEHSSASSRAHDALAAERGITSASRTAPLRDALAVSVAFAFGAALPWLAIAAIPGPSRAPVTFVIVLAALALTGWLAATGNRSVTSGTFRR